jgi:hypothetical protein
MSSPDPLGGIEHPPGTPFKTKDIGIDMSMFRFELTFEYGPILTYSAQDL